MALRGLAAGWEVSIPVGEVARVPQRCAMCGAVESTGWQSVSLSADLAFLQCADCTRLEAVKPGPAARFAWLCVALSGLFGASGAVSESIPPAWVILVVPTVLAVAMAALLAWAFFMSKASTRPSNRARRAVRFRRLQNRARVYFCRNEAWARDFSAQNGAVASASRESIVHSPVVLGLFVVVTLTPLVSLLVWDDKYPALFVDNASNRAIRIWIDGKAGAVVPPNEDGHSPTTIRVSKGKHRLGSSATDAGGPEREVEAEVVFRHRHLYNPGELGCYWRRVVLYEATSSSHSDEHHDRAPTSQSGPIALQEFYDLPGIDDWFEDSPKKSTFGQSSLGYWRVALVRNTVCTEMSKRGCEPGVRQRLISCETVAKTDTDINRCIAEATTACPAAMQRH